MAAGFCPAPDPDAQLVQRLVGTVDCNIDGLAARGYAEFASASGPVVAVLTALLTLYVAFIGYRLLLGRGSLSVGEFVGSSIKIGGVLVFATNWSAYQVLVYDLLTNGPQQLAAQLLAHVQPDGTGLRDPLAGLQAAYDALAEGANFVGGRAGAASPFTGGVAFTAAALNGSAILLLVSTLGVLLAAKIVLALLLALAPVLVGLFLFDATRGVLQGWLKAAVAFALAPLAVVLTLAVELTALAPMLIQLSAARAQGEVDAATAVSVALLVLVFAGVLTGLIVAGAVMAGGLRLPGAARRTPPVMREAPAAPSLLRETRVAAAAPRLDRAAQVGAALASMERRESQARLADLGASASDRRVTIAGGRTAGAAGAAAIPLGSSYRRPPLRPSASARTRDGGETSKIPFLR